MSRTKLHDAESVVGGHHKLLFHESLTRKAIYHIEGSMMRDYCKQHDNVNIVRAPG